jgi:hypothetical protein
LPSILRTLAATIAVCVTVSSATAGEPIAERERTDAALCRAASKVVVTDPEFRGLYLLVSVVDRIAVIGGAVPTERVGRLAADRIREKVPGLTEVKNRCFVSRRDQPFDGIVATPKAREWPDPSDLPGLIPGADLIMVGSLPVRPVEEEIFTPGSTDNQVVVRRPTSPANSLLLPPVVAPPAASRSSSDGLPFTPLPPAALATIPMTSFPSGGEVAAPTSPRPAPAVPVGRPPDVLQASEAVRKADPRYAGLHLTLKEGGAIVIDGSVARNGDAWELGEALRGIPGVTRVAMGAIEVK